MGNCVCQFETGHPFGDSPKMREWELSQVQWPLPCAECDIPLQQEEIGLAKRSPSHPEMIFAICPTCLELVMCFFCSCGAGSLWSTLRKKYTKLPLGKLTEVLSKEAAFVLIERIDQWIEEDRNEEGG